MIARLPFLLGLFVFQVVPPANRATERAYADAVSTTALVQAVHNLVALGPRMGGTPSGDQAASFLEQYFTRLGLKTEVFTDPPKLAHWEDRWQVTLASGEVIESAWPYGFSASRSESSGPIIAV